MDNKKERRSDKLKDVLEIMKFYDSDKYNCYFSGNGDGTVSAIIEENAITFK